VAYVSLYRKYRPQTFEDVVGQGHVIQTLVHAIEEDRLHHAYLFTGPRGTGKTSTARLLAKAINCEQGPTPDALQRLRALHLDRRRQLGRRDRARHGLARRRRRRPRAARPGAVRPGPARRKVYILDEVHMASTAAFNALLKLIEEPPAHVLFAMATTDPQKVLPTILSRVQRLDLRRVAADDVAGNVRKLCDAEGYTIDDGAVEAIVRAGDGSLRDTQSVLEQVLAFAGTEVTADAVAQVLGQTPPSGSSRPSTCSAARDLAGLLALVQGLLDEGHDLRRFTLDLVQHCRDLLVLQVAPDRPDLVDATDERRRRLQAQTTALPERVAAARVDLLAETVAEQRQGSPRLPLELALAKLAVPGADGDVAELADRVARLEAGAPRPLDRPRRTADLRRNAPSVRAIVRTVHAVGHVRAGRGGRGADAVGRPGRAASNPSSPAPALARESRPDAAKETPLQARARARSSGGGPSAGDETPPTTPPGPPAGPSTEVAASATSSAPEDAPGDVADRLPRLPPPSAAEDEDAPTADPGTTSSCCSGTGRASSTSSSGAAAAATPSSSPPPSAPSPRHRDAALRPPVRLLPRPERHQGRVRRRAAEAIERACGLKLRGRGGRRGLGDDRRRPVPPSVTPDDARTPVLDDDSPSPDEVAEVREAEHGGGAGPVEARGHRRAARRRARGRAPRRAAPGAPGRSVRLSQPGGTRGYAR
jgi:DNA polymerase III subunit gamma/tau